ncbi:MAG: glycosyltransferase [Mahellales bacterium]
MLLNTYMVVFLWIMALFGVFMLAVRIISAAGWPARGMKGRYSIIITVENNQENIEDIIRSLILKDWVEGKGSALDGIVVVDRGSTDDTLGILSRLARQYPCLKVVKPEDLKGILTEFIN